jgi:hypothetical protein
MRLRLEIPIGWCAGAVLLVASSAHAQELSLSKRSGTGDPSAEGEHPRGSYCGVKPGGEAPRGLTVKAGEKPTAITWPGFQMRPDGSSRVFLQATTPIDTQAATAGDKVVVDLGDVRIVGTNRFPLYTQYFNTPVTRVEIKRAHNRTTLELTLRAQVQPRISTEQAKSGFFFVYLDFPAGDYLPKGAAVSSSGPPTPPKTDALEQPDQGADQAGAQAAVDAEGSVTATIDDGNAELPPGMAKPKAKAKAKAKTGVKGSLTLGGH